MAVDLRRLGFRQFCFQTQFTAWQWVLEIERIKEGGWDHSSFARLKCNYRWRQFQVCFENWEGDDLSFTKWCNGWPDILLFGPCYLWLPHPIIEEKGVFCILNKYLVLPMSVPWAEDVHKYKYILHCVSCQHCVCHVDRNISVNESVFGWALEGLFEAV